MNDWKKQWNRFDGDVMLKLIAVAATILGGLLTLFLSCLLISGIIAVFMEDQRLFVVLFAGLFIWIAISAARGRAPRDRGRDPEKRRSRKWWA